MSETWVERLADNKQNLWDRRKAETLSPLGALAYRSNLLGSDRAISNYGGGNTSAKVTDTDHVGREIDVMWVKGSGSDLADITEEGFTGLRLEEIRPLMERDEMNDGDMVTYLSRCQLWPSMPRPSIETLLHSFIPYNHVDHTHSDATNMICCAKNGEQLAKECWGDEVIWIPYTRPGFTLSKWVAEGVRSNPEATVVLLAKHGIVTWGDTGEQSYSRVIEAINRAAVFVGQRGGRNAAFGGQKVAPLAKSVRADLLASVLSSFRGATSQEAPKIVRPDDSEEIMVFVCARQSRELSQVGAACPDHLIRTKVYPLWIDFDPSTEGEAELRTKLLEGIDMYREQYMAYFDRHSSAGEGMFDPNPRVVLIPGVGMLAAGENHDEATLARDFYHRAVAVIRGASCIDKYVSLTEAESFAIEYWPLELYKLSMRPAPKELAGRVALVTGGAGGIGSAACRKLAQAGACLVVADLNRAGAAEVADELNGPAEAVGMDVTKEEDVAATFRAATAAYGGVDIVVSNAGLASSAPIDETSAELWDQNHAVLAKGYFLVAREAFRLLKQQASGGSIVFVASKNGMAPGKNASAYSSAKAAELHLARCLAEEGGPHRIRVNSVNPDAVLQGSRIWSSEWRAERAETYGITAEELEEYYRQRNTLKVSIYPEDIAEAILFLASPRRSSKSTGNVINVDGGVAASYPR